MIDYEDTVMPATGECCSCSIIVDEGDNYGQDGEWLCWDCLQDTVRSHAIDWFGVACEIVDDAALAGVDV